MKNKMAFVIVKEKNRSDNNGYSRRNGTGIYIRGSNGEQVRLADFRGKNVVLYFYPKDMTQGVQLKRVISVILMDYFKRRTRLFLE